MTSMIACLPYTPWRTAGAALFKEAASKNAATPLQRTGSGLSVPVAILSDNGPCSAGRDGLKKRAGFRTHPPQERVVEPEHGTEQFMAVQFYRPAQIWNGSNPCRWDLEPFWIGRPCRAL